MKQEVAILMSTYNGERFLAEQIESLLAQTHLRWRLYIRDDGSTDGTLAILRRYAARDLRILLCDDPEPHRGVRDSFLWLLRHVEEDRYMFCDQDDVWLPEKIAVSLVALPPDEETPALVCTDLKVTDQDLNVTEESMWRANHTADIALRPEFLRVAAMYPGCTMLFNRAARDAVLEHDRFPGIIHDQAVSLSVLKAGGSIIPLPQATILYRQHDGNAIGTAASKGYVRRKLASLATVWRENRKYYQTVHSFLGIPLREFLTLKLRHLLKY